VSYDLGRSINLTDRDGNHMTVIGSNVRSDASGTFTVTYLGETFRHTIYSQITRPSNFHVGGTPRELEPPLTGRRNAEISFIEGIRGTVLKGPIYYGSAWISMAISLPFLLLGVASIIFSEKFWTFRQKFQWHIKGGEPTEYGIFMVRLGGFVLIVATFIFSIVIIRYL